MSGLCIFLNTRVENSGTLAEIGDKGLAPFRYLFNGKTIRVFEVQRSSENQRSSDQRSSEKFEIHHVESFHKKGKWRSSSTDVSLKASPTGMIKTALSIVFLIPGFILGAAFKGSAYLLFSDIGKKHDLIKEHFTPVDRTIGSIGSPITSEGELEAALDAEGLSEGLSDRTNHVTNALIIHGDGNLTISKDPGILKFNPMKLVLVGARIIHGQYERKNLDVKMLITGEWQPKPCGDNALKQDDPWVASVNVKSVEAALQGSAPIRESGIFSKRYRMIYSISRQQTS